MRDLKLEEIQEVSAGRFKLRINLGTFIGGMILGIITGGPVGLGYAIGAAIIAQGVNSLDEMHNGTYEY